MKCAKSTLETICLALGILSPWFGYEMAWWILYGLFCRPYYIRSYRPKLLITKWLNYWSRS